MSTTTPANARFARAHPVDSTTRTCCGGIGAHAPRCANIHEVTAKQSLSSDLWVPSCACGWTAPPCITIEEAARVGEAHYTTAVTEGDVGTQAHNHEHPSRGNRNTHAKGTAMTTTTDISTPDVPLPAGSIGVGDWRRSPNDGAFYRNFLTRIDEVAGLEVRTVGAEVVEDAGGHVIAREIKLIRGNAGVVAALTRGDADALGRALIKSAALVAELEADDVGAVLLDTADQ